MFYKKLTNYDLEILVFHQLRNQFRGENMFGKDTILVSFYNILFARMFKFDCLHPKKKFILIVDLINPMLHQTYPREITCPTKIIVIK